MKNSSIALTLTMSSFQDLAKILSDKRYVEYAERFTQNRADAEDLVSDFIIKIHERLSYWQRAEHNGNIRSLFFVGIRNLYYDRKRAEKIVDSERLKKTTETSGITEMEQRVLEKINEDLGSNEYHKLVFREVQKHGGVTRLAKITGISPNTLWSGVRKYKSDLMNIKKILLITNPNATGVGYHRILKPYTELAETRNDIMITRSSHYINRDHDIIIFNRLIGNTFEDDRAIIREAKICGQRVIMDVDDYWVLPPGHLLEHHYNNMGISKRIEQNIREADLVTTTHEVLALRILKLNKNVAIIPNAINENDQQWKPHRIEDDTYRFGFVGSRAHTTDIPLLRKACNKMHRGSGNFKFIFMGWAGDEDPASRLFEEVLSSRGTGNDRYGKIAARPVTEYGLAYNIIDCSLAPLEDTLFNRCKSNLKILEAAAHKLPIICSKIHPYLGSDFDRCVLFAEHEISWYNHMQDLMKNPKKGRDIGAKANEILLKKYTYSIVNKLRTEII